MTNLTFAWAQFTWLAAAAPAKQPQSSSIMTMVMPLLIMFGIIYFLVIMPQRKKQRQRMELLKALRKNDKIVTVGGIHGVITHVRDREVIVKVDDNVKLTINRTGIAHVKRDDADEEKSA